MTAVEIPKGQNWSPTKVHSWPLASPACAWTILQSGREVWAAPDVIAITVRPPRQDAQQVAILV